MNKISLIKKLRENLIKDSIYFVQIGANDGDTNDIAKHIIDKKDAGIFIEPSDLAFNKLVLNKSEFVNCLFLNIAIVPENISKSLNIHILSDDDMQQGSSLFDSLPSSHRAISNKTVNLLSIQELISKYSIDHIDIVFCDTEGTDHALIQKLLDILQPNILVFESFDWLNNDQQFVLSNGMQISIPSKHKIKNILLQNDYSYIDFNNVIEDKSEDIVAWKNTLIKYDK